MEKQKAKQSRSLQGKRTGSTFHGVSSILADYYHEHGRKFPWRDINVEPYAILVTEVMLRRTTASKVAQLWSVFFSKYKNMEQIAQSTVEDLAEDLRPLGLHRQRAKQLKHLASQIVSSFGSELPSSMDELLALPGLGAYSASAYLIMTKKKISQYIIRDTNIERNGC